jgi:uncharacterized membrane protein
MYGYLTTTILSISIARKVLPMIAALHAFAFLSLILSGAIFGFFYAWICSTMWGLDAATPAIAIQAMQAMNASVRNATFAPAFFGTPIALFVTSVLALACRRRPSALAFGAAGTVYLLGDLILTMTVNVPMNQALALVSVPEDAAEAKRVWLNYSIRWQFWNTVRTVFSGVTLILTGLAIFMLSNSRFHASVK